MQIDWLGRLTWFPPQPPVRTEGWVLLGFYGLSLIVVLIGVRHSFSRLSLRQWALFVGLLLAAGVFSNVVLWRYPTPASLPVPDIPQETQVRAIPLLGALPLLLSACWLGVGPTVLLGLASGLVQAVFQIGSLAQPFEVAAFCLVAAYLVQQNYRGWLSSILRQPVVAGLLAAFLTWLLLLFSLYGDTPGSTLAALNYAWPIFLTGLLPALVQGLIAGGLAQFAIRWRLARHAAVMPAIAPPWSRSLNRRMLFAFITFTSILIVVLLYAVSATALAEAKRQALAQMSRDAMSAASDVPSFFQMGQGLVGEFAVDERLQSADSGTRQSLLGSALRIGPFFDQLLFFDADGRLLNTYPLEDNTILAPEERDIISRTLQTGAPQTSAVFKYGDQSLVSFVAAVLTPAGRQGTGALLGRTRLEVNPIIARLRDGLQNTLGAGVGYIVDESGRIVVHRDAAMALTPASLNNDLTPVLQTPEDGKAYEDSFPNGTPRLLFIQPARGTNWTVAIELPYINVLQLAAQISMPLLIILVIVGVLAGAGLSFLTRAITRPIQDLSAAAVSIAQGQLEQPVTLSGDDEVGRLGSAFEQMRVSLKARLDDLSLLVRVSQTVSASLDLERGVPPLLAGALQASPARVVRLVLASEDGLPQTVLISGEGPQSLTPLDQALAALVAQSTEPILIDNVARARARAMLDPSLIGPGIRAIAALPVRRQSRSMGVMWLGYVEPHAFSESEVNVLGTLASQAAVLVENARLFLAAEGGRRRLQAVLTSTSDAVIVTDRENRVLLCNPAAEVAFGLEPGRTIGQLVSDVWPSSTLNRLLQAEAGAATRTEEIMLPDGRTLYGSASGIISSDGQTIGRVAVLRDITHLKELDSMKSEFVATVSHDLRAPLTYMRGYATMLPMVGALTPKQQDYIEKFVAGIEQMTELIDDLLDLGRIEAGVGLVRDNCSLADVAQTVVEAMTSQAQARGLTLSAGALAQDMVNGDQGLLRHAITNLVDNAIKYTPSGGSITIAVERRDGGLIVTVKDTGIGIAPADQARLFERFYRVKRRETIDIKGTGLGLAIVKSIAEWHGGRVWVESQLGAGSTFYFFVPLKTSTTT